MNEDPVDISNYLVFFDPFKGINIYDDAKITNLNLSTNKILSLLHNKIQNPMNLDEFIEPHIKDIL